MKKRSYNLLVLICGSVSMGFQIVAGFLFNPIFGGGIFTWGSIIGSILCGLSLGYMLGGKVSETRYDEKNILGDSVLLLSFIIVLVGLKGRVIADSLSFSNSYIEPLLPALILFGTPAIIFGMINPIVVSMRKEEKGIAAGNTFSYNAFGSIIGVFFTSFYLIPFHGIDITIGLFFIALIILHAFISYNRKKFYISIIFLVMISVSIFAFAEFASNDIQEDSNLVHSEASVYKNIQIKDSMRGQREIRSMVFNNGDIDQSRILKEDKDKLVTRYYHYAIHPYFSKNTNIDQTLVIGGGGFVLPRAFSKITNNQTKIDVVEHDKVVYNLAQEYMYYKPDKYNNIKTHIVDGREYIENTDKKYDYILMDAYTENAVPSHMTTQEYYRSLEKRLDEEEGVLGVEIVGTGKFYKSEYRTINSVFEDYNSYVFETPSTRFLVFNKNRINASTIVKNMKKQNYDRSAIYVQNDINKNILISNNSKLYPIITDDKNPSQLFSQYN